jgi:selenocysteine-specific elongation factor
MAVLGRTGDGALRVELRLDDEAVLAPGDRFILRRPSPVNTVGGGVIVEALPPRTREPEAIDLSRVALEPALRLRLERSGSGGRKAADLAVELGRTREEVDATLAALEAARAAVRAGGAWFDAGSWERVRQRVRDEIDRFHETETLRSGMSREALRARAGAELSHDAWRDVLASLEAEGVLRLEGERAARAGHRVALEGPERELAERIDERFRAAGLDPPELGDVVGAGDLAHSRAVVTHLVESGRLVKIQDGRLFHADALAELRDRLRRHAATSRRIDVAAFKALAGVSRKNAIPLLEQLDAERSTRRVGNEREILL